MPCKRHRTCPCLLQATPEHPFYILNDDGTRSHDELGQGWIRAKDLKSGDIILLLDGTQARIESVAHEQLDEPVKVYNFEVEDYHTYFVGHGGWLVHNFCYTDKVIAQMSNSKDLYHSFPSIIDSFAGSPVSIAGRDGSTYYKYTVGGSINGNDGYYCWIVDAYGYCNHRCFE